MWAQHVLVRAAEPGVYRLAGRFGGGRWLPPCGEKHETKLAPTPPPVVSDERCSLARSLARSLALVCGLGAVVLPAAAQAEKHRVCIEWDWLGKQGGFRDVSPRPPVEAVHPMPPAVNWNGYNYDEDAGDDYGRRDQPGDFAPRRMLVQVTDGTTVLWGWNFLDDVGCTETFSTQASTVYLSAEPWSKWANGNQVVVLDCTSGDCLLNELGPVSLAVTSGVQDIEYTTASHVDQYRFALHWAMSFAEERRSYHAGQLFYGSIWAVGEPGLKGAQANLLIGGRPTVTIKMPYTVAKLKTTLAHECGHLQTLVSGMTGSLSLKYFDYCYPNHCTDAMGMDLVLNHSFDSPEWQGAAAAEGFAHFYGMSVWNETDGVGVIPRNSYSDNGETIWLSETEIDADRTDDAPESLYGEAMYSDEGMAVERDWTYFLWDAVTGAEAFSVDTVMHWLASAWNTPAPPSPQWPVADTTTDWWDHFATTVTANFSSSELTKFNHGGNTRKVSQ